MTKQGTLSHNEIVSRFLPSTTVLSMGYASVLGRIVPAVFVRSSVYGQELVWGSFGCKRGKFVGNLSQNATTEGVRYTATDGSIIEWTPPFGDEV